MSTATAWQVIGGKMKILIIGCSNGVNLHKDFNKVFNIHPSRIVNLSKPGVGNRYITARLFEYVNNNELPDYVYLQYSGLSRIDIPLDKKVVVPDYVYQTRTATANWVASGGINGSWNSCEMLKRFFAYMYPINKNQDKDIYSLSLNEIFSGIELCKTLGLKYNWSTYYDYTSPPNDKTKIDGFVAGIPDYIDQSNHIKEHPLNLAYTLNKIPKDAIHYESSVGEAYLERNRDKFNI